MRASYRFYDGKGTPAQRGTDAGRKPLEPNGILNPVTCEWIQPPATDTARLHTMEEPQGGRRHVSGPPSTGVFNPVTDEWIQPPANPRFIPGLTFTPRSMGAVDSSMKI